MSRRERIHRFAVQQDIELRQAALAVPRLVVVERGVTARDALQLVVKIEYDFRQRHVERHLHPVLRDEYLIAERAALVDAKLDDVAQVIALGDDLGFDVWFLYFVHHGRFRQPRRIVYVNRFALFRRHPVRYVGYGGDDVHVEFAVEALLDDFHVEQAEEAAAETESEGEGAFRVERERGVVELELLQRGAQVFVLVGLHGIDAREDHRFHILETGYRFGAGVFYVGYRIAHLHLAGVLDARYDVAHVTRPDFLPGGEFQFQNADFIGVVLRDPC